MPQELATNLVEQFHTEHPERYLLAFVYGWLDEHDLMGVRTEAEKYLMLGALNLVECVAFVGGGRTSAVAAASVPSVKMGRPDAHAPRRLAPIWSVDLAHSSLQASFLPSAGNRSGGLSFPE